MNLSRHILLLPICVFFLTLSANAQPGFKVDIEKPAPYQERKLKSEKTGDGKLKTSKRIMQNLTTRFNYYFNANNKLNEVLDRAKEQHKDDYAQLLSFYNYDLETTVSDSVQLDSVIYKARTGIANHDLRNEWIDELYLLWATSWHLQKKFDSASLLLQFINYAYAPQYEDGFYKHIGTNADGARELSIVTKEDKKFLHSNTFSRNNAFLWQIRTLIEREDMTGAGSLITTLRRDPAFPNRLQNGLDEVEAYWWYRQQRWDSAAVYLLAAIDGDHSKLEKARWYYLAAQLMEKAGNSAEAEKFYQKVVSMTPDPVMEVYARLNTVRLSREGGVDATDKNLAELLKMARRDKYEEYRDIIYFMAAQMELERGNFAAASELLIKGAKYNTGDQASKNKAFLRVADVLYDQKKYLPAASFYDSLQVAELAEADELRVTQRKTVLQKVVLHSGVVSRQDSLQRIAALPEEERNAYVKSLVKKLRKQQGLKEEAVAVSGGSSLPVSASAPPADLFSQQKGEWYFYNNSAKAQGAAQFKAVWGNRPNTDNWRRFAVANMQQQVLLSPDQSLNTADPNATNAGNGVNSGTDLSIDGLTSNLPLTPEAITASNDSIRQSLWGLGMTYLNEIDDLPSAIATLEELRRRFPDFDKSDEVLFRLSYAYGKTGNQQAAAEAKRQLAANHPSSRFATIVSTGKDPVAQDAVSAAQATKAYENVYNLFIEGRFADAENAKRIADSTYKTTYWQPQLLYIESVYFIKQRQDEKAKEVLETIVNQNTHEGLTMKAQNLLNVLERRQEIEDELTRLQITRPVEEEPAPRQQPVVKTEPEDTVAVVKTPEVEPNKDSAALALQAREKEIADSIAQSKVIAKRLRDSLETLRKDSILLAQKQADEARRDSLARKALADKLEKERTDSLAAVRRDSLALAKKQADEARRDSLAQVALAKKLRTDSLAAARKDSIEQRALAAKQLRDSLAQVKAALDQVRKDSIELARVAREQARKDSIALAQERLRQQRDSIALAKRKADSIALNKPPVRKADIDPSAYYYEPERPHFALVILDRVDPIFVSEARTAFLRYNRERYNDLPLDVQIVNISSDLRMLVVSGLPTAAAATEYVTGAQLVAATEIIPWLKGDKYTFSIISARNLQLLKTKGDVPAYKAFLEQHLPGKF